MTNNGFSVWELLRISSGLGLVIAIPISGGTVAGFLLDKHFNSRPILTLIFLSGGIFLAIAGVMRKMKDINETVSLE